MIEPQIPSIDWLAIAPELSLFAAAVIIVLGRSIVRHSPRVFEASLLTAVTGIVASAFFTALQWIIVRDDGPYQAINGMVAVDGFSVFVRTVVLLATSLALLISTGYLRREGLEGPEYVALMLLSATGMAVMVSANDLIVVFLALEVLSIALYVLAAFDRNRLESQEAGLKYFVLGAFSSAVFLYGVALVYGATGTTALTGIARFLATTGLLETGTLLAGLALLLVGLGFKIAAAPFHMWAPDVYQGSPTPVTAFMAAATKAAAFGALLRVLMGTFDLYRVDWRPAIWGLAVLSLVVGSVGAVVQTDVKRMLAYSSVSHAGYAMIGVQVATDRGTAAALVYLLVYAVSDCRGLRCRDGRRASGRRPALARRLQGARCPRTGPRRDPDPLPARAGRCARYSRVRGEAGCLRSRGRIRAVPLGDHRHARRGDRGLRLSPHRARDVHRGGGRRCHSHGDPEAPARGSRHRNGARRGRSAGDRAGVVPGRILDFARDATLLLGGAG
ncbi:MAG: NADH-quinone oxidoreductase subunit N [Acidimicrobiia bacterium]|nr:NADH-quinone oxidoreductase subunit N [Acidimicrobiia bacterium]